MFELLIVVAVIAAFDVVAVRWGADSRATATTTESHELPGGRP
jgi:hypothetical protein